MKQSDLFAEFDMARVKRLLYANAAIGSAYIKKSEKNPRTTREDIIAATCFRRAAANSILLGDFDQARALFRLAATCYQFAGMPYASLMEALSGQPVPGTSLEFVSQSPQGVYQLFGRLREVKADTKKLHLGRQRLDEFKGRRIGIFALPVDNYLDLFDAINNSLNEPSIGLKELNESLLPFVQTYSSAYERARRDTYHWQRLAMVFHPVEPDIVGLLIMTNNALSKSELRVEKFLEKFPIKDHAKLVLNYVLQHLKTSKLQDDTE